MLKRIVDQIQDFFGISRKEARGTLVLMVLTLILIWTPFVFRRYVLPFFPVSSEPANVQKLDSIVAELNKSAEYKETDKPYSKPGYSHKPDRPVRLFTFDPNKASVDQLTELGIPAFLSKRIDKYRSKGGQFRKKDDLLQIYDFPADLYKKLEPYISLPVSQEKAFTKTEYKSRYPEKSPENKYTRETKIYTKPVIASFDINYADTAQLVKLKGIGSKLSLRILKFRDALGGFHSVSQFSEIFGLDSLAISELNRYAKIESPVKKININTATVEELSSHTYLRNKKIASVIVNYREQHGNYKSPEDLKKVRVLDEVLIGKIAPYLEF